MRIGAVDPYRDRRIPMAVVAPGRLERCVARAIGKGCLAERAVIFAWAALDQQAIVLLLHGRCGRSASICFSMMVKITVVLTCSSDCTLVSTDTSRSST